MPDSVRLPACFLACLSRCLSLCLCFSPSVSVPLPFSHSVSVPLSDFLSLNLSFSANKTTGVKITDMYESTNTEPLCTIQFLCPLSGLAGTRAGIGRGVGRIGVGGVQAHNFSHFLDVNVPAVARRAVVSGRISDVQSTVFQSRLFLCLRL